MGSDRARVTYDGKQQYRAVVAQQGRVTVEADWNEAQEIAGEEARKETLDVVGPRGTPDNGYAVDQTGKPANPPFDFTVGKGTMYVGGLRVELDADVVYASQPEWLDDADDVDWVDPSLAGQIGASELVYLKLREQEVGAVEDSALREVALGGPDTAARTRLIQHVVRLATGASDCAAALAAAEKVWAGQGLTFDPESSRLVSSATLKASFVNPGGAPDPCEPRAHGGYLEADNQLIRVQVSAPGRILWGFDNASFLYRTKVVNATTLQLLSRPVDEFHQPRAKQAVEVLRSAARLSNGEYVASATGFVTAPTAAYDPDTQTITIPSAPALPGDYQDAKQTPRVFLRVWEEELPFAAGTPVSLGNTGLQVTLQTAGGQPFHVGDYWLIAVRPGTPTEVYPRRFLDDFQPPNGPRLWACPLAVISWNAGVLQILADCREQFDNLVDLTKRKLGGCCTVSVRPEDLSGSTTLQSILDSFKSQNRGEERITICLMPGVFALPEPLRLNSAHSGITIEGCHDGVYLRAASGQEDKFLDGLVVLNRADEVTLRGLRFELPQIPFAKAGGRLANLGNPIVDRQFLESLHVSIGVRPVHCAGLTVENCLFRFSLTSAQDVFGVGIFGASECWGITLKGNRFLHGEEYLRSAPRPFRFLAGYLLAPTTVFRSRQTGGAVLRAGQGGSLVRSLLDGAAIRENRFAGLTVGALIYGDAGEVAFEGNTVRDCFAGFWYLSLRATALAELTNQISVEARFEALARRLQSSLRSVVTNPIIQVGAVLARSYPLPSQFDASHAIQVEAREPTARPLAERPLIQNLFNRALSVFGSEVQPSPEGSTPQTVTLGTPAESAAPRETATARLNTLNLHLSEFEQAALTGLIDRRGLQLVLRLSNNDVDARVEDASTGTALLVWEDQQQTLSELIMSNNQIRNQASNAPAAVIVMVDRCAITGNLILNEEREKTAGTGSLDLFPGTGAVAVTGNIFRGVPILPPRPAFTPAAPPPMNTWLFFNTEI